MKGGSPEDDVHIKSVRKEITDLLDHNLLVHAIFLYFLTNFGLSLVQYGRLT